MRSVLLVTLCCLLSACANNSLPLQRPTDLFHDEMFSPASMPIRSEAALEVSEAMRAFARSEMQHRLGQVNNKDLRAVLIDALYKKGDLRLEYYSDITRTAAEAFAARSGNCLSLVLLTAAFAKELNLPFHYQSVVGMTDWSQSDYFFVSIGHVDLVLETVPSEFELHTWTTGSVVVDFLTPEKAALLDAKPIEERTVLAMYLNDAYWWVRAALLQDESLINSYLTLGVIYRSMHHSEFSVAVFEQAAAIDPDNTAMLTDWILALQDLGRQEETRGLSQRLSALEQQRPWRYYFEAQAEYRAGHYENARTLYEKEIARNPDHHESEYGLALDYLKLHDPKTAMTHLERAILLCRTKHPCQMYRDALEKLKAGSTR